MTEYKILGQSANDGNEEDLYSVPSAKSAVVRAINVTNTSSTADTFDIAINDSAIVPVATDHVVFSSYDGSAGIVRSSTDGIVWQTSTVSSNFGRGLVSVANSTAVVVSTSGLQAAYSTDLVNWTTSTINNYYDVRSVVYGEGKFVIGRGGQSEASSQVIQYSTDGATWTLTTMPSAAAWVVAYGGGTFVAVDGGYYNSAAYSTDAITWTASTTPTSQGYRNITYGNGKFLTVQHFPGTNLAAYSTDGAIWTPTTLTTTFAWKAVGFVKGHFIITANANVAQISTDAITWTQVNLPAEGNWELIYEINDTAYMAIENSTSAAQSTDAITWTATTLPFSTLITEPFAIDTGQMPALPEIPSEDYLFKTHEILGNETITIKGGYTMEENNTLRIKSTNGTSTFHAFGGEI